MNPPNDPNRDKAMMTDNYRIFEFSLTNDLTSSIHALIQKMHSVFPKRDLYLETTDTIIRLYLAAIDLDQLTSFVSKFKARDTQLAESSWLKQVLTTITGIKSYGIRNGKRIYVGYDQERKVQDRQKKNQSRGSWYYAQNASFSQTNNEFPPELSNQIVVADSERRLQTFPDNSIDLIFTSPPYNFGLDYDNTQDWDQWPHYFEKLFRIFKECIRVLKYSGRIVINVQPLFSSYIPSHHIISDFFRSQKLI